MRDIGRRLRTRREELGLSLEQVQEETKIRRRYLEALENGDETPIPGEVYLKGFLRAYGNFLGLGGPELVREYREGKEEIGVAREDRPSRDRGEGEQPSPPALRKHGPRPRRPVRRVAAYVLLLVALVSLAGVWYLWNYESPGPVPGGDGAAPPDGNGPPGQDPGEDPGREPGEEPGAGGPPGNEPGYGVVSESAGLLSYVVYGAPFTVGLEIVEDRCWVRATVDGRVLLEGTLSPGGGGTWTAQNEVVLVLGRPQLAELTLNGGRLGRAGTVDAPRTVRFRAGTPPGG